MNVCKVVYDPKSEGRNNTAFKEKKEKKRRTTVLGSFSFFPEDYPFCTKEEKENKEREREREREHDHITIDP